MKIPNCFLKTWEICLLIIIIQSVPFSCLAASGGQGDKNFQFDILEKKSSQKLNKSWYISTSQGFENHNFPELI